MRPIPVYGDGLNVRDWLYVEDHCKAIELVVKNGRIGEVYNIGGHNERTNIHIVKTIINYLHNNLDEKISEDLIIYVSDRMGHDRRYGIDPTKIKNELDWAPSTTFEVGIESTIKWYLNNTKWLNDITTGKYLENRN
jgi:dTDP-glucose 4,6-dehydratase